MPCWLRFSGVENSSVGLGLVGMKPCNPCGCWVAKLVFVVDDELSWGRTLGT